MGHSPALPRIQRWMQAVITHPGTDADAVQCPQARREIRPREAARLVLPSRTLTSIERVGIYRGMYVARLCEALEADYPALVHFLGKPAFQGLAEKYVHAHPSHSYTLNRLGDCMPEYLRRASIHRRKGFVCDLARLELAMTQVFDEQESKPLSVVQIARVPANGWAYARLRVIPALRILSLRYPAHRYVEAVRRGRRPPAMTLRSTRIVVYRSKYALRHLELSPAAFDVLGALADGRTLGESLASAGGRHRDLEKRCYFWFRDWISMGFFQSIALPSE